MGIYTRKSECPSCRRSTIHQLLAHVNVKEQYYSFSDGTTSSQTSYRFVSQCESCSNLTIWQDPSAEDESVFSTYEYLDIVWPIEVADRRIPKNIFELYGEFVRLIPDHPTAAAIQLRKSIEACCNEFGAKGNTLFLKIRDLKERGYLPQPLFDVAEMIRETGNLAAHEDTIAITLSEIWSLDRLFRLLTDYLFILPGEISELRSRMIEFPLENTVIPDDAPGESLDGDKDT